MSLNIQLMAGRLLARNEKLDSAKLNAMFKSLVIITSGAVGSTDLAPGAVNAAATSADAFWYGVAVTSGTGYVVNYTNAVTSYIDGMWLSFRSDKANAAKATFNAGAGAMPLVKWSGQYLAAGDIVAGTIVTVRWNATSSLIAGGCWEVMSLIGPRPIVEDFRPASLRAGGERGLVPRPKANAVRLWLRDDGWQDLTPFVTALVQAQSTIASNLNQFLLNNR